MLSTILDSLSVSWMIPVLLLLSILGYLLTKNASKSTKLPPGPSPYPLLGNLELLTGDTLENIRNARKQYGDVITLYTGNKPTVFLCSHDAIKDALVRNAHAFSGRQENYVSSLVFNKGIVYSNGVGWQQQRHFAHTVLRQFGMGRYILEEKIQDEIGYFLSDLLAQKGKPFDPHHSLQTAITNIICSITYGVRYEYRDPVLLRYLKIQDTIFALSSNVGVRELFPWLTHLPGDLFSFRKLENNVEIFRKEIVKHIENHKKTHDPGVVNDFIDAYLDEIDKTQGDPGSSFTEDQLSEVIADLFAAGSETTTTTLRWAMLYMARNPEVAKRVRKEIDEIVGPSRMTTMKDRAEMAYCEATLLEVQRLGDIAPMSLPHCTTEDVVFRGYEIAKGTQIMPVLHCAHHDPKTWPQPFKFNPDRFIGSDGKLDNKENVIAFSMGKRVCPGESLARMELFLFFTAIMQRLEVTCPVGRSLDHIKGVFALTHAPEAYELSFNQRRY